MHTELDALCRVSVSCLLMRLGIHCSLPVTVWSLYRVSQNNTSIIRDASLIGW